MDDAIDYGFGLAVSSIPIISDIIDAIHMIIMAITNFSKFFSSIIGVAVLALAVWLAYTLMKDYVDRIKWFEKGKPLTCLVIRQVRQQNWASKVYFTILKTYSGKEKVSSMIFMAVAQRSFIGMVRSRWSNASRAIMSSVRPISPRYIIIRGT